MALSGDRNTKCKSQSTLNQFKLKANTTIYAGALVATDTNGLLVPASDTASLLVMGRANERAVSGASDTVWCKVQAGVYKWVNSTGAAVTSTSIGKVVYVEDDQTVAATGGSNNVKAGIALQIDDDLEIWVKTDPTGGI